MKWQFPPKKKSNISLHMYKISINLKWIFTPFRVKSEFHSFVFRDSQLSKFVRCNCYMTMVDLQGRWQTPAYNRSSYYCYKQYIDILYVWFLSVVLVIISKKLQYNFMGLSADQTIVLNALLPGLLYRWNYSHEQQANDIR